LRTYKLFCTLLLATIILDLILSVLDYSTDQIELSVASYYGRIPEYIMIVITVANICFFMLKMSDIRRAQVEV
jgi:hypothetical protein